MSNYLPIPVPIIFAAIEGNDDALLAVVEYYRGYIRYLSMRPTKDAFGNETLCVDENMTHKLEAKLMESIVTGFTV